jgi:hypothetical protein
VEMGECASKFCVGSIFPLVEIRLRIAPRSTFTVCTGTDLRPEKTGISNAAAITPMTSQLQRRPLFPFELFSEANLFSSRARQEFAQATIYHPKARETSQSRNAPCLFRCCRLWSGRRGYNKFHAKNATVYA